MERQFALQEDTSISMTGQSVKDDIIRKLQREVLSFQAGKKSPGSRSIHTGLGPIEKAFPEQVFPFGAIHEFLSTATEDAAATNGFIGGLLSPLMQQGGACLWISNKRIIFPPALKLFGLEPDRVIFVDAANAKDALWAVEEALKCEVLAAVVGEIRELSFTESRRLQLAVEHSRVTGFIHRYQPRSENTTACVTRWKIKQMASVPEEGMPGVGSPKWNVQLIKVRNGKPGAWDIEWSSGGFQHITKQAVPLPEIPKRKAG